MLLNKIFKDKNGQIVIWQRPNLPAYGVFLGLLLGFIPALADDLVYVQSFTLLCLVVWGMLELLHGVNLLRRFFGLMALIMFFVGTAALI